MSGPDSDRSPRRRGCAARLLRGLAALSLGGVLAFVVAEVAARVVWRDDLAMVMRRWVDALVRPPDDPEWYLLRPGVTLERATSLCDEFSTNSLGFRDREHGQRPAGAVRVAMIGDSFTMGNFDLEDCYVPRVEAELRSLVPDRAVDVMNGSRDGTGPAFYYLYYEKLQHLAPDIVVASIYFNDFWDDTSYYELGLVESNERGLPLSIANKYPQRPSKLSRVVRRSTLACKLMDFLGLSTFARGRQHFRTLYGDEIVQRLRTDEDWSDVVPPVRDLLLAWNDVCAERGQELFVVVIPTGSQVSAHDGLGTWPVEEALPPGPYLPLAEDLRAAGVPVLDLTEPMRRQTAPDRALYLPDDSHWTARGNAVAAREVAAWLRANARALR